MFSKINKKAILPNLARTEYDQFVVSFLQTNYRLQNMTSYFSIINADILVKKRELQKAQEKDTEKIEQPRTIGS